MAEHADRFELVALAAGGNVTLLAEQVRLLTLTIYIRTLFPYTPTAVTRGPCFGAATSSCWKGVALLPLAVSRSACYLCFLLVSALGYACERVEHQAHVDVEGL